MPVCTTGLIFANHRHRFTKGYMDGKATFSIWADNPYIIYVNQQGIKALSKNIGKKCCLR